MGEDQELYSWVALHGLPGMGPITFKRLIDRFGSAAGVLERADGDSLSAISGMTQQLAGAIFEADGSLERVRQMTDTLRSKGVRVIRITDADYPAPLHDLSNPPPLLYMVGEILPEDACSLAMVGTTKPSNKGRAICEAFAARLAAQGVTVVSGYAHGCDAAAHRGAYKGGGRSILVLPFGIRQFRPRADFPPVGEMARRGALISECPPEQEWSSAGAIARNRLIAALGRAVFVAETRPKGGTMHTVKAARTLERPLFAVKYKDAPESARGNSILIGRGATGVSMINEIDVLLNSVREPD
jgi:DNA processing protein